MSSRTDPAGWVVQVTIPKPPEEVSSLRSAPPPPPSSSFVFFNVATLSRDQAVELAIKAAKAPSEANGRVVRALSASEVAALRLSDGQAKPA